MRRQERVESLLAAAARAFARTGYAATSMEDIAAEAGVTKLIVYRHFAGKQELYEAVLARVSERLVEEFRSIASTRRSAVGLRALLTVAREDPDGFLLLFRHAAREAPFAGYAADYLDRVSAAAEVWLAPILSDRLLRRWAARVTVRIAVESVIAWLETGEAGRDEEFLSRSDAGLRALVQAFDADADAAVAVQGPGA